MSVFRERAALLDELEFKYGIERGRLAAALDLLSDLAIVLGTHVAYCRQSEQTTRPTRDMQSAMQHVEHVKELVVSLLHPPGESASQGGGDV